MLKEEEIRGVIDNIVKNEKSHDLVKIMNPLDIAKVIAKDLSLCPKDAVKATIELISKTEALSGNNIETNKQYPVPAQNKRNCPKLLKFPKKENAPAKPFGKVDITPKFIFYKHQFPPDPRGEVDDWPYDDMTKTGMKPVNKSRKRPLMMGKNPLDQDLRKRQPGGDGAGGGGIYQKNSPHFSDNSMSTAGNSSWSKRGVAGWSSSPPGKEFDLPYKENEEEISIEKNPPVGTPVPMFGFGGRADGRRTGRRQGFRRK